MTAFTGREAGVTDDVASQRNIRAAEARRPHRPLLLALVPREAAQPTLAAIAQRAVRHAAGEVDNDEVLALINEGRAAR